MQDLLCPKRERVKSEPPDETKSVGFQKASDIPVSWLYGEFSGSFNDPDESSHVPKASDFPVQYQKTSVRQQIAGQPGSSGQLEVNGQHPGAAGNKAPNGHQQVTGEPIPQPSSTRSQLSLEPVSPVLRKPSRGRLPRKCGICGARLASAESLKQHWLYYHRVKPYRCEGCGAAFTWWVDAETHDMNKCPGAGIEKLWLSVSSNCA